MVKYTVTYWIKPLNCSIGNIESINATPIIPPIGSNIVVPDGSGGTKTFKVTALNFDLRNPFNIDVIMS